MGIRGLGTDLCDVSRVALAVERTGERFLARVYTGAERDLSRGAAEPARDLARRFALKEAAFKALAGGWPDDMAFTEVDTSRGLALSGRAAARALERGVTRLLGHAADDGDLAFAVVVAEGP